MNIIKEKLDAKPAWASIQPYWKQMDQQRVLETVLRRKGTNVAFTIRELEVCFAETEYPLSYSQVQSAVNHLCEQGICRQVVNPNAVDPKSLAFALTEEAWKPRPNKDRARRKMKGAKIDSTTVKTKNTKTIEVLQEDPKVVQIPSENHDSDNENDDLLYRLRAYLEDKASYEQRLSDQRDDIKLLKQTILKLEDENAMLHSTVQKITDLLNLLKGKSKK